MKNIYHSPHYLIYPFHTELLNASAQVSLQRHLNGLGAVLKTFIKNLNNK